MGDMGQNMMFFCEKGEERRNCKFKVVREYKRYSIFKLVDC